jgi:hypothetical protein
MKAFVDGNKIGLVNDDFVDLQESDVVWIDRIDIDRSKEALTALLKLRKAVFD